MNALTAAILIAGSALLSGGDVAKSADSHVINAPATIAQADSLILHGGKYAMGKGRFLFEDDSLSVEAMNVAKHAGGKGWHRTFEDEDNGTTFIGAYNLRNGCSIGIEVTGKWTLTVTPLRYGCR